MALVLIDHYMVFNLHSMQTKQAKATNECTSITGHFDGHAEALKQYTQHQPMQQIQGHISVIGHGILAGNRSQLNGVTH